MNQPDKVSNSESTQNPAVPAPAEPTTQPATETPVKKPAGLPFLGHSHPGAKSPLESYLAKNEYEAMQYEQMMKKIHGEHYTPMKTREISSMLHLHEYMAYEMTRSRDANVLRGRTFVEYGNLMLKILKERAFLDRTTRIAEAFADQIRYNKEEVDAFVRATCVAIREHIKDEQCRRDFVESLKKLYDEYYIQQESNIEQLKLEYPNDVDKFKLTPPVNIEETQS